MASRRIRARSTLLTRCTDTPFKERTSHPIMVLSSRQGHAEELWRSLESPFFFLRKKYYTQAGSLCCGAAEGGSHGSVYHAASRMAHPGRCSQQRDAVQPGRSPRTVPDDRGPAKPVPLRQSGALLAFRSGTTRFRRNPDGLLEMVLGAVDP